MQVCLVESENFVVKDVRKVGGTVKEILEWVVYTGEESEFIPPPPPRYISIA